MTDPFAAAEVPTAQSDPFNGPSTVDASDPFATGEDLKGGPYTPSPSVDDLEGRLVVMIPRQFRSDAPIFKDFIKEGGPTTQDRYTVDLYVLGSEPLVYSYKERDEKGGETGKVIEVKVDDMPACFKGVWINRAALVGQLRKVDGSGRPLLMGVMRKGPQSQDRRNGATFDTIATSFRKFQDAYAAYVAGGMKGAKPTEPRYSWQVDVLVSAEQRAVAMRWWESSKDAILPIGKAPDVTGQK